MNANKNVLNDNWQIKGSDYKEFCSEIKAIDERTRQIIVPTNTVGIFTKLNRTDEIIEKCLKRITDATKRAECDRKFSSDKIITAILSSNDENNERIFTVSKDFYLKKGAAPDELMKELRENGYWLTIPGEKHVYVSSHLLPTMGLRAGISGLGLEKNCYERNAYFVKRFSDDPDESTVVIREIDVGNGEKIKKAFSMLSGRYTHIPQTTMLDIISSIQTSIGEVKCRRFEINNNFSEIYLYFPEIAEDFKNNYNLPDEILPGLYLKTSDCGESSFVIQGIYCMKKSSEIIFDEYSRVHKGTVDINNIVSAAKKIYNRYTELPEKLLTLMTVNISNPEDAIKNMSKRIGLVKAIGKKTEAKLVKSLIDEIPINTTMTGYDIVMNFITLPERITNPMTHSSMKKLQKCVNECAYVDFDNLSLPVFEALDDDEQLLLA